MTGAKTTMRCVRIVAFVTVVCAVIASGPAAAIDASTAQDVPLRTSDPLTALSFLEGTWTANATGAGTSSGKYTFRRELGGHVLARHAATDRCAGPNDFDCGHGDLLYVYPDGPGSSLKAIYLDNEGHVLHYTISTPEHGVALFLTEPGPGPCFRLVYTLQGTLLSGKFQMQAPSQDTWTSYLEWSGPRDR